jgi:DNA (cytosine-5)-methyltransferase 1
MIGGSLFSGYRGLDIALERTLGVDFAWHVESDPNASKVLAAHSDLPNHGDITTVDWARVEPVDLLCGFPCQDISSAGLGVGIKEGTRSGLWYRYADAIRVLRPRLVVVENVGALLVRGLDIVLGSLAELGYDAQWTCLRASDVGACHRRERMFLVAWPADAALPGPQGTGLRGRPSVGGGAPADAEQSGSQGEPWPRLDVLVAAQGHRPPADLSLLPTPTTEPATGNGHARNLGTEVRLLPTPTATDATGSRGHRRDGTPYSDTSGVTLTDATTDPTRWGRYASAIARHERIFGRPAPDPTDDRGRLSPRFVEWMMMLPEGWVTDHLGRGHALRCLGNGVVPAQASAALSSLLFEVSR